MTDKHRRSEIHDAIRDLELALQQCSEAEQQGWLTAAVVKIDALLWPLEEEPTFMGEYR